MKSYIRVEFGGVTVTFKGSENFMERELPKLVTDLANRVAGISDAAPPAASAGGQDQEAAIGLPEFIRRQSEETQVRRFLAAAAWLQANQTQHLTSGSVVKALQEFRQTGVGNASDCLNANITKGFCERRKDKTFFVTPAGLNEVGIDGYV